MLSVNEGKKNPGISLPGGTVLQDYWVGTLLHLACTASAQCLNKISQLTLKDE